MTEKRMSFFEHVYELRDRIRMTAIIFVLAFFIAFIFSQDLLNLLWMQFLGTYSPQDVKLQLLATSVMSGFVTQLHLAFLVATAVSVPLFLYEMFMFVEPALSRKHKTTAIKIMLASGGLFIAGVLFIYFVMLPLILAFFIRANTAMGIANYFSVESFFEFIVLNLFIGGMVFQTPLIIITLNRLGILPKDMLVRSRRVVYVVLLIVAGVVTPDSSIISQLVLGGMMAVLFEISLLFVK